MIAKGYHRVRVDDLRKPDNASGYQQVGLIAGPSRAGSRPYYQAYKHGRDANGQPRHTWKGPARQTPEEAAQDFCDYVNGLPPSQVPKRLRSAGHKRRAPRTPSDAEVALRKLQREAQAEAEGRQGYVYCIAEDLNAEKYSHYLNTDAGYVVMPSGACVSSNRGSFMLPAEAFVIGARGVKIGYSVDPLARVAELQTGNPRKLTLIGYIKGTVEDEARIHRQFHKDNVLQEWFRPSRELLSLFVNKEG